MAMDLGAKGSLKADINVTPLVDVMLVLLIIMMLIAPLLQQGVARVYTPKDFQVTRMMSDIVDLVAERHGAAAAA